MVGNYEEGIMKSMLEFLFSSEITFPGSWAAENRFGDELDEVMKLGVQVKAQIGEEHSELWKEYQEKTQGLENRQCRMEFERGFLTAANLALEIFHRSQEG